MKEASAEKRQQPQEQAAPLLPARGEGNRASNQPGRAGEGGGAEGGKASAAKARKPRCRKVAARCRVAGCAARPWFAQPGASVPLSCKDHKKVGEVNIYAPACEAEGCRTRPNFGWAGARARFCYSHKLDGMEDLLNRRCATKRCSKQPSWSLAKGTRAMYCGEHKKDGMFDTRHRTCLHPGCPLMPSRSAGPQPQQAPPQTQPQPTQPPTSDAESNRHPSIGRKNATAVETPPASTAVEGGRTVPGESPSAGAAGWGPARYCAAHAPTGSVNVTATRCREHGCTVQPTFGREGAGEGAVFCARHRKRGMTDVKNPRCRQNGCVAQPRCGREGDPRPTFCLRHADPDMVNVRLPSYSEEAPPKKKVRNSEVGLGGGTVVSVEGGRRWTAKA